jgi:hypothetical protein
MEMYLQYDIVRPYTDLKSREATIQEQWTVLPLLRCYLFYYYLFKTLKDAICSQNFMNDEVVDEMKMWLQETGQ